MKYTTKKIDVEAIQWNGQDTNDIAVHKPVIIFSRDERLFYLTNTDARDWLSVEKKENGKYDAYPFALYEIKSKPEHMPAEERQDLADLYLEIFNLKKPETYAYYNDIKVNVGDWIVIKRGQKIIVSDEDFKNEYE